MTDDLTDVVDAVTAHLTAARAEVTAALQPQIAALTAQVADLNAQIAVLTQPKPTSGIIFGARVSDIPWTQAVNEIGPLKVTRMFYKTLPATYTRAGYPTGVKLIISFKDPTTNVASYVKSIPAGEDVELVFHHEAEADYATGAAFVTDFNTAQKNVKAANPKIPVAFIGGGYQYGASNRKGWDGSFIPPNADFYYMDSYQHAAPFVPVSKDASVQRYLTLLTAKGKQFNGFTEYGRGPIPFGGTLDPAVPGARQALFPIDAAYLRSLPAVRVWSYWYTLDGANPKNTTPDQWRLTDLTSQQAWRSIQV